MTINPHLTLAAVHAALCLGIACACICRLTVMTRETQPQIRAQFALLVGGALSSGGAPLWWGEWPGYGAVTAAAALLAYLLLGLHRWRHGAPPGTRSDWMGLSAPEHPAEPAP